MWKGLLAAAISSLLVLLLVLAAEFAVRRARPDINHQDTELTLLEDNAFGATPGFRRNATGVMYGLTIETDAERLVRLRRPESFDETWVLLGDSVTVGPGVPTELTYAQLLQDAHPRVRMLNYAVIAWSLDNYSDALAVALADHPDTSRVLLFYCLNDIDQGMTHVPGRPGPIERVRGALRRHSKLYMLLKELLADRSRDHWAIHSRPYTEGGAELERAFGLLQRIADQTRAAGVPLTVVLLPFEYQLRGGPGATYAPQEKVGAELERIGVPVIDLRAAFEASGQSPKELFLYADAMHLSVAGHRLVATALDAQLPSGDPTGR